jgi:hypothetical protein
MKRGRHAPGLEQCRDRRSPTVAPTIVEPSWVTAFRTAVNGGRVLGRPSSDRRVVEASRGFVRRR